MAPYITILLAALLVGLFVFEWLHQRRLSTRVRLMREALRNRDFMFRLPTDSIMPGERDLQKMLNEMGGEINKLMARSEVESWQRLTRLSAFVDSYRKMTQLQTVSFEEIDLQRLVSNLQAFYPSLAWHVDINDMQTLRADASMMHQVLTNIVKNAAEAGAHNIDICARRTDQCTQLLISNDGTPIAAEVAREVFVPFFTTKRTGSGIGLSLSRQMMMAQGGDLALAERPQAGYHATFVVTL